MLCTLKSEASAEFGVSRAAAEATRHHPASAADVSATTWF
jgi:hypothetical protein